MKNHGHTLPDTMDKAFELQLRRVATKGVVRLFNTVKEFQMRGFNEDESLRQGKVPIKKRRDKMVESAKDKFEKLWSSREKGDRRVKRRAAPKREGAGGAASGVGSDAMDEFG